MKCQQEWHLDEMDGDHITPWSASGATILTNLQILCKDCIRRRGAKKPPIS